MNDVMGVLRLFLVLTLLTGAAYPVVVTLTGRALFPEQVNGSLLYDGKVVTGSRFLAQAAPDSGWFQPRPSAGNYATLPSCGGNYAVSNAALRDTIRIRAARCGETPGAMPPDLVFSSGSGLDPHISPNAAVFQARRIGRICGFDVNRKRLLDSIIKRRTEPPQFGLFGEARVNVLLLNADLDALKPELQHGRRSTPAQ